MREKGKGSIMNVSRAKFVCSIVRKRKKPVSIYKIGREYNLNLAT